MRRDIQTNNSIKNVNCLLSLKDNLFYMIFPFYSYTIETASTIFFIISAVLLLAIKSKNTLSIIFTILCIVVFIISTFALIISYHPEVTISFLFSFNCFKIQQIKIMRHMQFFIEKLTEFLKGFMFIKSQHFEVEFGKLMMKSRVKEIKNIIKFLSMVSYSVFGNISVLRIVILII